MDSDKDRRLKNQLLQPRMDSDKDRRPKNTIIYILFSKNVSSERKKITLLGSIASRRAVKFLDSSIPQSLHRLVSSTGLSYEEACAMSVVLFWLPLGLPFRFPERPFLDRHVLNL